MIPSGLQKAVQSSLKDVLGTPVKIKSFSPVAGGCINESGRLETEQGSFFLKWNRADLFPGMFETEARGLDLIRQAACVKVPEVICTGKFDSAIFIVLEFIGSADRSPGYWEMLGHQMGLLHGRKNSFFGLDHNNYIGSLPQQNEGEDGWADFFIEKRLKPQLRMAVDSGKMGHTQLLQFERLFGKLSNLIPSSEPSLLHGDLWGGNLMIDQSGMPCLVDPSVYFGHPEVDIAMTFMFGGFDKAMYRAYEEISPLTPGWKERSEIHNLYPLLVHVNLFGGSYTHSVVEVLNRY